MQVGFSQRIQLEWLEQTAQLFMVGNTKRRIEEALQDSLRDQISIGGNAKRGNREKAITILLKVWVTVPKNLEPLRDDGLDLLRTLPSRGHLPVHWGMSMAVYPFFGAVAETVGRLLNLQDTISAAQVQRRVRERLGERETVARAARRILRSLIDWEVLKDTEQKGIYRAAPKLELDNKRLRSWLVEAQLISKKSNSLPLKGIMERPTFFPFRSDGIRAREIENNRRLSVFRHGLDEDMVVRRN
jgi:hypothetical protein